MRGCFGAAVRSSGHTDRGPKSEGLPARDNRHDGGRPTLTGGRAARLANAKSDVKKISDHVTGKRYGEGVIEFLRKLEK